jgi:hypothetical protein
MTKFWLKECNLYKMDLLHQSSDVDWLHLMDPTEQASYFNQMPEEEAPSGNLTPFNKKMRLKNAHHMSPFHNTLLS